MGWPGSPCFVIWREDRCSLLDVVRLEFLSSPLLAAAGGICTPQASGRPPVSLSCAQCICYISTQQPPFSELQELEAV